MARRTDIACGSLGSRTIMGTQHRVEDVVQRVEDHGGSVTWVVLRGLCNGVPDSSEPYKTRREALEAAGLSLGEGIDW